MSGLASQVDVFQQCLFACRERTALLNFGNTKALYILKEAFHKFLTGGIIHCDSGHTEIANREILALKTSSVNVVLGKRKRFGK